MSLFASSSLPRKRSERGSFFWERRTKVIFLLDRLVPEQATVRGPVFWLLKEGNVDLGCLSFRVMLDAILVQVGTKKGALAFSSLRKPCYQLYQPWCPWHYWRCEYFAWRAHQAGSEKTLLTAIYLLIRPLKKSVQVSLLNQAFPKPGGPGLGEAAPPKLPVLWGLRMQRGAQPGTLSC